MKIFFAALLALGLSGCAAWTSLLQTGAQANDAAALAAMDTICRGVSVGAWTRAFGGDPEKARAWQTLCENRIEVLP